MRAMSLFSGAGGMDVGFVRAGFRVVVASEIDAYACNTFRMNHPKAELIEGDVTEHIEELGLLKNIDVIFGGPPCQGFSVAGKMSASDPRSALVFSFVELVERVRPNTFVMENVKSLATLAKFSDIRTQLISRFRKAGYCVQMHILNAKDFGVPQSRERVFFVGVRSQGYSEEALHAQKSLTKSLSLRKKTAPTLREVITSLGKQGSLRNDRVCNAKITLAKKPVLRKSPYAGMLFNGQGRPLNPDGWASTLPASMGGNRTPIVDEQHLYEHKPSWVEQYHRHLMNGGEPSGLNEVPSYLRRLTINEVALLQGFPEEYEFCGPSSRVYTQIGNAVPCDLAYAVADAIASLLSGEIKEKPAEVLEGESLELVFQ